MYNVDVKQHITVKQLNELTESANKKLVRWIKKRKYYNFYATSEGRLLSIGQMIEFVIDHNEIWRLEIVTAGLPSMCDDLWEAVKEKLTSI